MAPRAVELVNEVVELDAAAAVDAADDVDEEEDDVGNEGTEVRCMLETLLDSRELELE